MKKKRFRNIKQNKSTTQTSDKNTIKSMYSYAPASLKVKAFLTDAFMLLMPIMYIVFYLIMDGREDFAAHRLLGWIEILVPLIVVQTLFMYYTSQTPGYRAYNLKLIDDRTQQKPSLFTIVFRNLCAVLSLFSIAGWVMMFFQKESKTLHDLLSATAIVIINEPK
jgi:uncharacterized RDD family membrane protein YckC